MDALAVMTISAAGKSRPASRGFTLIELLVVLVVMALVSGVMLVSLPRSQSEISRLADQAIGFVEQLSDDAVIDGRPRGIELVDGQLTTYVYGDQGWVWLPRPSTEPMPDRLVLNIEPADDFNLPLDEETGTILLQDRQLETEKRGPQPRVLFNPTGDITGFVLTMEDDRERCTLTFQPHGQAEVQCAQN